MARPYIGWFSVGTALWGSAALAQSDPLGLQFVTVGSPGNPAYQSPNPNDFVNGRGQVNESYRIGQYEVNTAQWTTFFNAARDRAPGDSIPFVDTPLIWGAVGTTPNHAGAQRWRVPTGNDMLPVGGISWRTAAIFCNWLCHGANPDAPRADFLDGAYAVSSFGWNGSIFTDQAEHTTGAQFFLPSWDMWLKAAHWSPNNPNNNGWYTYSNSNNVPYVYGPPGVGQANAGPGGSWSIPLGSYPGVQSPWGLFDTAGGSQEWTESIYTINTAERFRVFDGSYASEGAFYADGIDQLLGFGAEFPHVNALEYGLRIASVVPAPPSCALALGTLVYVGARRRRR